MSGKPRVSEKRARQRKNPYTIRYEADGVERAVWANGLNGEEPAPGPGEGASYPLVFRPGLPDIGDAAAAEQDHRRRYRTLLDLAYDAAYEIPLDLTEQPPVWTNTGRPGSSPLVAIESYLETPTPDVWALIDGVSSSTRLSETSCQATLDVTALATFEEYGREQRGRLKNDLEYSGI